MDIQRQQCNVNDQDTTAPVTLCQEVAKHYPLYVKFNMSK